jgi:hypothetical protein
MAGQSPAPGNQSRPQAKADHTIRVVHPHHDPFLKSADSLATADESGEPAATPHTLERARKLDQSSRSLRSYKGLKETTMADTPQPATKVL